MKKVAKTNLYENKSNPNDYEFPMVLMDVDTFKGVTGVTQMVPFASDAVVKSETAFELIGTDPLGSNAAVNTFPTTIPSTFAMAE
jgi:hypothetical protein